MRAFQRIGLGDDVANVTQPHRDGDAVWFTDSQHRPLFGTTFPAHGLNGWRDIAFFDQPELDATAAMHRQTVGFVHRQQSIVFKHNGVFQSIKQITQEIKKQKKGSQYL